jgi:hypothetical protein
MEPQFTPASPGDRANGTCTLPVDRTPRSRGPFAGRRQFKFPTDQFAPMIPVAIQ